jgi:hypothetical protein
MRGLEVKLPALVEERLQRHGIHVGAVLVASEGPRLRTRKPVVTCSALSDKNTTNPGPVDHFPDPSSTSVAVGN